MNLQQQVKAATRALKQDWTYRSLEHQRQRVAANRQAKKVLMAQGFNAQVINYAINSKV